MASVASEERGSPRSVEESLAPAALAVAGHGLAPAESRRRLGPGHKRT